MASRELIGNIFAFLKELKAHNNREWFAEHKERYLQLKAGFEALTDELIARIGLWDEEVKGLRAKDCVYRIYRDVRFLRIKVLIRRISGLIFVVSGAGIAVGVVIICIWSRGIVCWQEVVIVLNRLC